MRMAILLALPLLTYAVTSCSGGKSKVAAGPPEEIPVETFEYEFVLRLEPNLVLASYEPGPAEFVLENIGEEAHELQVLRLDEGRTLQDSLDLVNDETTLGPPDWVTVEGAATAAPGEHSGPVAVDLREGSYLLACFLQTEEGVSHASLGMNKSFTVE